MHNRGLYVQTDKVTQINILMVWPDGKEERIETVSPAEDLVDALEPDYRAYRTEIQRLRDEHPLFEEGIDIAESDYHDFLMEAMATAELLRNIDPVSYFVVVSKLDLALRIPDDGSASFLLYNGQRILYILEEPVLTQLQLRNIFEVTFANTERATQAERYKILRETYPQLFGYYFKVRHLPTEDGNMPFGKTKEYSINSLLELRMLELEMYFRQTNRIARCAHCWGYFMPKTKKETLYCDRVRDGGKTCKQLGPNAQRRIDQHNDNALAVFEVLRKRMGARHERYMESGEKMNTGFILNVDGYFDWSDEARQARMDYLEGKITGEQFIHLIDKYGELTEFVARKTEQDTGESVLERLVRQDLNFDPSRRYFDYIKLDLGEANPQWKMITAEEWMKRDKGNRKPLAERVEDLQPKKTDT